MLVMPSQDFAGVNDKNFYHALGARIAEARKAAGMTQVQLAEELGVAQQTLAHYEVGRARLPASMLPQIATTLAVTVEDLLGDASRPSRRGPTPKLLQQVERIQRLPKSQQRFVMQMIDTALQASQTAEAAE